VDLVKSGQGSVERLAPIRNRSRPNKSCNPASCACLCHEKRGVFGRFWGFSYTPLSNVLQNPVACRCETSSRGFNLRLALSQFGISRAIVLGFDIASEANSQTLRPVLALERIVKYTSPGFEALWRFDLKLISADEARKRLRSIFRSDPTFKYHRDPAGKGYLDVRRPSALFVVLSMQADVVCQTIRANHGNACFLVYYRSQYTSPGSRVPRALP